MREQVEHLRVLIEQDLWDKLRNTPPRAIDPSKGSAVLKNAMATAYEKCEDRLPQPTAEDLEALEAALFISWGLTEPVAVP